jgi:formylglycine-generating enzyme required for sulfatase activity
VQAKVKALRRGASADLCDLLAWGEKQGLSRICLVRAKQDNTFSAQLIDVEKRIAWGSSGRYASGDLSIDQSAVPLKKTAWAMKEQVLGGGRTPTILCRDTIIEPEMVFVKGSTFTMGCVDGRDNKGGSTYACQTNEQPAHPVTLSDFWIGKYELTQAQWYAVMGGTNPGTNGNYPVAYKWGVTSNDIPSYLTALNQMLKERGIDREYRLPTEAEWEYAARGGVKDSGYMYSGSDIVDSVAWSSSNSGSKTHEVGKKRPNQLGICDMSGNVWEWCSDVYSASYYSTIQNGAKDPTGPSASSVYRVLRGGCWLSPTVNSRNACRFTNNSSSNSNADYGFRVVLDLP